MRALLALALIAWPTGAAGDVELGGARWKLGRSVATGSMPWGITVSADGANLYVTHVGNKDRDNVRRYDAATLAVAARASFRGHAVESVLTADGRTLYVSNSRRHEILALDAETLAVEARHPTGKIPKDFKLTADGRRLYVADHGAATVSVIEVATGRRRAIRVGQRPRGIAIAPDGATVYVTNMGSGTVSVIDAATLTVTATWRACRGPRHVVALADGRLLVSCLGARALVVLDRTHGRRVRAVTVGRGPKTIAITRDARFAISADERGDSITLIDLATYATKTLRLPARQPCGVAVSPDDRRVYVTARGSHELIEITRE